MGRVKVEIEMTVETRVSATIDVDPHEVAEWLGRENSEPTAAQIREFLMSHRDYDEHLSDWYTRSAPIGGQDPWLNLSKVTRL